MRTGMMHRVVERIRKNIKWSLLLYIWIFLVWNMFHSLLLKIHLDRLLEGACHLVNGLYSQLYIYMEYSWNIPTYRWDYVYHVYLYMWIISHLLSGTLTSSHRLSLPFFCLVVDTIRESHWTKELLNPKKCSASQLHAAWKGKAWNTGVLLSKSKEKHITS